MTPTDFPPSPLKLADLDPALVQAICAAGRDAYARGLLSGTEGNLSIRYADDRVLCTPSGQCKGRLTPDGLCVVDLSGQPIAGVARASSEIRMHLEIYRVDPAVRAVVHTHPPYATTFALLHESPPSGVVPEAEAFLGPVPLVPYDTPGTQRFAALIRPFVAGNVCALLASHGAVAWGATLDEAYLRTETLESVCRVIYQARLIGEPRRLPVASLQELAALRAKLRGD